MTYFFDGSNYVSEIAHAYEYLYDGVNLNDIKYLLDDVVVRKTCGMILKHIMGKPGGITSFDEYSHWSKEYRYGSNYVCNNIFILGRYGEKHIQ